MNEKKMKLSQKLAVSMQCDDGDEHADEDEEKENGRVANYSDTTPLMGNLHDSNDDLNYYGGVEEERIEQLKDAAICNINNTSFDSSSTTTLPHPSLSVPDRFAMLMSNYDPRSIKFSDMSRSSTIDDDETNTSELERVIATYHRVHPGIHHSSFRVPPSVTEEDNRVSVEEEGGQQPLQRAEVDLLQTQQP